MAEQVLKDNEIFLKLSMLQGIIRSELEAGSKSGLSLRRWGHWLKGITIFLSAVVTIVLGLNIEVYGNGIALVISAVVTAIGAWEAFTNYNQRSIQEYGNVNKLFGLFKDIQLYLEGNLNLEMEQYNQFKVRYDQIHEEYLQERKRLTEEKNKESGKEKSSQG